MHALPHTFATRLAQDRASATEIQRLLGDASLNTSQRYIDATAREHAGGGQGHRTYQRLELLTSRRK